MRAILKYQSESFNIFLIENSKWLVEIVLCDVGNIVSKFIILLYKLLTIFKLCFHDQFCPNSTDDNKHWIFSPLFLHFSIYFSKSFIFDWFFKVLEQRKSILNFRSYLHKLLFDKLLECYLYTDEIFLVNFLHNVF